MASKPIFLISSCLFAHMYLTVVFLHNIFSSSLCLRFRTEAIALCIRVTPFYRVLSSESAWLWHLKWWWLWKFIRFGTHSMFCRTTVIKCKWMTKIKRKKKKEMKTTKRIYIQPLFTGWDIEDTETQLNWIVYRFDISDKTNEWQMFM